MTDCYQGNWSDSVRLLAWPKVFFQKGFAMDGLNRAFRRIFAALAAGSVTAVSIAAPAVAETGWRTFGAAFGDPRGGYVAGAGAC